MFYTYFFSFLVLHGILLTEKSVVNWLLSCFYKISIIVITNYFIVGS